MTSDNDWREQRRRDLYGETPLGVMSVDPSPQSPPRPDDHGGTAPPPPPSYRPVRPPVRRRSFAWGYLLAGIIIAAIAVGAWLLYGRADTPPSAQTPAGTPDATRAVAASGAAQRLCADNATLTGLRAIIFARAHHVGGPNPTWLEARASTSTLRIDDAYAKALDSANAITVCAGRATLQLPGGTSLSAAIDYSILPAVDARGRVYTLTGADDIIRQLVELEPADDLALAPAPAAETVPPVAAPVAVPDAAVPVEAAAPTSRTIAPVRSRPNATRSATSRASIKPAASRKPAATRTAAKARLDRPRSRTAQVKASASLTALDNTVNLLASPNGTGSRLDRRIARDQAAFIARRDRCTSESCLVRTYRARIDQLARLRAANRSR